MLSIPTASTAGGDDPQVLFAVTEMVPEFVPGTTTIVFVVEDPDQPIGSDHV